MEKTVFCEIWNLYLQRLSIQCSAVLCCSWLIPAHSRFYTHARNLDFCSPEFFSPHPKLNICDQLQSWAEPVLSQVEHAENFLLTSWTCWQPADLTAGRYKFYSPNRGVGITQALVQRFTYGPNPTITCNPPAEKLDSNLSSLNFPGGGFWFEFVWFSRYCPEN